MSHFRQLTVHPKTGEKLVADWIDNYFGEHRYGVRFPDGEVLPASSIPWSVVGVSVAVVDEGGEKNI